jgi:hypothetical protein
MSKTIRTEDEDWVGDALTEKSSPLATAICKLETAE